ncbi:MAG TPA: DUF2382 domain-containing protein [Longimicrobiaceae bacterium]|nr:DUF2382 domain-containing protein [Longimicrobiaceae bacterium]
MMNDDLDRVVPLDQLDDFKVADGDPDVRGWEVVASDGRKIGEVDQLLVDTAAMKVRYLDVDVDNDLVAGSSDTSDRHVLIPIGYARLDEGSDRVIVDQLASSDIVGLPEYTHGPITRDFESSVRSRFDTGYTTGATGAAAGAAGLASTGAADTTRDTDNDFYSHDLYDDNKFYGARRNMEGDEARLTLSEEELAVRKQRMAAGEVDIHKRVETEHVSTPVTTMREEAVIERRPISDATLQAGTARIEGDEIRIPLMEEEVIVEKRVVPTEELVVRKHTVQETETVEADLRKERVDINRQGDAQLRDEHRDDRL